MHSSYGNEAPSVSVFRGGGGENLFDAFTHGHTVFKTTRKKSIFDVLSAEMGCYVGKKNYLYSVGYSEIYPSINCFQIPTAELG